MRVVGEIVASNAKPLDDYREVQVAVYDEEGNILGREFENWGEFGIRQTFEVEMEDLPGVPFRVKAFTSKGG